MEPRKKIRVGDQEVDAIQLTFQTAGEHWNEYLASDGSVLKMKAVATELYRIENAYDVEGNPQYLLKSTNILAVSPPDSLRRKGG